MQQNSIKSENTLLLEILAFKKQNYEFQSKLIEKIDFFEKRLDSMIGQFDNMLFTPEQVAELISYNNGKPITNYAVISWIKSGKLKISDKRKSNYVSGIAIKEFCQTYSKKYRLSKIY